MKALVYEAFSAPPHLTLAPAPSAMPVTSRSAITRSSPASPTGAPSPSTSASTRPTSKVGLLLGDQATPALPMNLVIAHELEILGSHGMQAHRYDVLMAMLHNGDLAPERLIGREISLADFHRRADADG